MDERKKMYESFNEFIINNPKNERISNSFKSRFEFINMMDDTNYVIYAQMRDKLYHQYMKYTDLFINQATIGEELKTQLINNRSEMQDNYKKLLSIEIKYIFENSEDRYILFLTSKQCFLNRLINKLNDPNDAKVKIVRETINTIKEVIDEFDIIKNNQSVIDIFKRALSVDKYIIDITKPSMLNFKKIMLWVNNALTGYVTISLNELENNEKYEIIRNSNIIALKQQSRSLLIEKPSYMYINLYKTIQQLPRTDAIRTKNEVIINKLKQLRMKSIVNDISGINGVFSKNMIINDTKYGMPVGNNIFAISVGDRPLLTNKFSSFYHIYKESSTTVESNNYSIIKYFDNKHITIMIFNSSIKAIKNAIFTSDNIPFVVS